MKPSLTTRIPLFAALFIGLLLNHGASSSGPEMRTFPIRVGFLGLPVSARNAKPERIVPWNAEQIARLKSLGFNCIQLNIAWGARPDDEPLNLEDIVELSPEQNRQYPQVVPLNCDPTTAARERRREKIRERIKLCKDAGLETMFHFGAPYNAHVKYGDGPPNCISDPNVATRYELLIDKFAAEFPGVDHILVYTYDQDAWLCSEFGPCEKCLAHPLHERLVPFLKRLGARWNTLSQTGIMWWEPWELSAGQVYKCVENADFNPPFGLAIHSNVAEVMATMPVDRWFKNTVELAHLQAISVIGEYWLGGPSEELEPLNSLSHPLVTLRGLRAIANVPNVAGIKEYYGLGPDKDDPNLQMTGIFLNNPKITDHEALQQLAKPYGPAAEKMIEFWRHTSRGMELFPWDTSWYIRQIGRSRVDHALSAAMLRGQQCRTPSWESTRAAIFMKTDDRQPDPWMIEDVELRCRMAADEWKKAEEIGREAAKALPAERAAGFADNMRDLAKLRRRTVAYACHLRSTNLATTLRWAQGNSKPMPQHAIDELKAVLREDLQNASEEIAKWDEMTSAITLLDKSPAEFLDKYLKDEPNKATRGPFSVTSR